MPSLSFLIINTVHLRKYPFHRGSVTMALPPPASCILCLDPLLVPWAAHVSGSSSQLLELKPINVCWSLNQKTPPSGRDRFPLSQWVCQESVHLLTAALRSGWHARWEYFRLQVSHTQQPMPFYGMVHPNVLAYQHSNVFLFPKDIPCWTKNAFFFKAIWPDAWKCEYFCPNIGSKQLKWILYLV